MTASSKNAPGKRGWEPSYTSRPLSASIAPVTTDGYLDTPAKYKQVAGISNEREDEQEMLEEMMEGTYLLSNSLNCEHRGRIFRFGWLAALIVSPKCADSLFCNLIRKTLTCTFLDLRPAKRRKTLTDSVVSTAYSAALISTAVGYTVYK